MEMLRDCNDRYLASDGHRLAKRMATVDIDLANALPSMCILGLHGLGRNAGKSWSCHDRSGIDGIEFRFDRALLDANETRDCGGALHPRGALEATQSETGFGHDIVHVGTGDWL